MKRREFLMLAHRFDARKHAVGGWFVSEKLDGTRCYWDGGISRGMPTQNVPWANIVDPKTGERKAKIKPVSTGLWSRYGNPIIAPDWWLNQLPCVPLDGELWAGRGSFQLCRSICACDEPSDEWKKIEFAVFGSPPFEAMFADGLIKNTNMHLTILLDSVRNWLSTRPDSLLTDYRFIRIGMPFEDELTLLQEALPTDGPVYLLRQRKLPEVGAFEALEAELERVLSEGGEGLVLRHPSSVWQPSRSRQLLKYKPFSDAEGTLIGFTSGRQTSKGSKLLGKIGALILQYKGKQLELSGLTDEEREFATAEMAEHARKNPGVEMPSSTNGKYFRLGDSITFKYRELSDGGIPKEARYWRIRSEAANNTADE